MMHDGYNVAVAVCMLANILSLGNTRSGNIHLDRVCASAHTLLHLEYYFSFANAYHAKLVQLLQDPH